MDAGVQVLRDGLRAAVDRYSRLQVRCVLSKVQNGGEGKRGPRVAWSKVIQIVLSVDVHAELQAMIAAHPGNHVMPVIVGVDPADLGLAASLQTRNGDARKAGSGRRRCGTLDPPK